MQCPIDGAQLVLAERAGVEIDYCPQCRGVWLGRGELDQITDRSGTATATPQLRAAVGIQIAGRPRTKTGAAFLKICSTSDPSA